MSIQISKKTLDQFVKLGGYEIVRFDPKKRRWKGISKASRITKIHRDTITRLLKEFPTKPVKKIMPKYYEDFKESTGYKRLKIAIGHRSWFKNVVRVTLEAFHFLGNKDPIYWTVDDIRKLRSSSLKMRNPITNDIDPNKATELRRALNALGKYDLLPVLKNVPKPPAGKKLEWYLEENDLISMVHNVERPDTLLYFYVGITAGARHSGIMTLTPERIKPAHQEMLIYEPKRKEYVAKIIPSSVIDLLNQYIVDFGFKGDQRIFPMSYARYNRRLKETGEKAGLTSTTTTHILKHTFVSQASFHGVSLDVVSAQTGTDEATLKKFYRAENIRRLRHELLGEEYGVMPFHEWVEKVLHPHFASRYKEIKEKYVRTNGILRLKHVVKHKAARAPPRKKTKRMFSWKAIKAITQSKPTTERGKRLRKYWLAIWKLHEKHPEKTYDELKLIFVKEAEK